MPPAPNFNSKWEKGDHPIGSVTGEEAKAYCEWAGGRLPTEAEWEYAARGGKEGLKYPWGDEISHDRGNYERKKGGTTPVGSYEANGFGLHDVAGNVWEWCADWFEEGYYAGSPQKEPPGPSGGTVRVLREARGSALRSTCVHRSASGWCLWTGTTASGFGVFGK